MNDNNFTENLFQSIDTIINARLANLQYDQTIEGEIINNDEAWEGKYTIKYQAATFTALGEKNAYSVGDVVYVQIPQRDFTQDKFILNKKTLIEVRQSKKLPFLSFSKNMNLSPSSFVNKEFFIKTTSDNNEITEKIYNFKSFYGEQYGAGYTKLGIKLSIKANLPTEYNYLSGDYGIQLKVKGFNQQINNQKENEEVRIFSIYTKDMISNNYYDTPGYGNQEQVFDITDFLIKSIDIELWQNGDFFGTNDEKLIQKKEENLSEQQKIKKELSTFEGTEQEREALEVELNTLKNKLAIINEQFQNLSGIKIYFTNISVYLGYDISEFKKSNIRTFLYTLDGYKYDDQIYNKDLYIRFVEAVDNKLNLNIMTEQLENNNSMSIYWEEYDPTIKTNGPKSNIISYKAAPLDTINNIYRQIKLNDGGAARLRYSFIVIIEDNLNHKYISNQLSFVRDTYLGDTELLNLLTSFFRQDDNGRIYLNGGANEEINNGLNIANVILNNLYTAQNSSLLISNNFNIIGQNGKQIITINNDNITIHVPIIYEND